MHVFVTGGTGFIGSAVVRDLLAAGHSVLALARSAESAARLEAAGAEPHPGSLEDLSSLRAAVAAADAVVHTAFDNSHPLHFRHGGRVERSALHAIGEVLAGSDRPMVAAGGFAPVIASGTVYTEHDLSSTRLGPMGRNVERTIMRLAEQRVNASIVRLPCVHGLKDHFTLRRFIDIARAKHLSAYVGEGQNRWPAVHCADAARVFRLALEAGLRGATYHAVGEQGVPYRAIAEVIGRQLNIPVVRISTTAAWRQFGLYAGYARNDGPASSTWTRAQLGWQPEGPKLLADLDRPEYFDT